VKITVLRAALLCANVSQSDLEYEGSISIDSDLLRLSGILPNEQVDVVNRSNGARFTTYAIAAPSGSRVIGINGAAARLVQPGDQVDIVAFGAVEDSAKPFPSPSIVNLSKADRGCS